MEDENGQFPKGQIPAVLEYQEDLRSEPKLSSQGVYLVHQI